MSGYILTYTKTRFYPLEPVGEDIKIEDIAHALSMMTRANGHLKLFYSVGQHAVNCCHEAIIRGYSKRVQLACLLHDASESYISDITRPVKARLPEYLVIEEKLQRMIYGKYGLGDLTEEELLEIKSVDDAMLYFEFLILAEERIFPSEPPIYMEHNFSQRAFADVEKEFLSLFGRLAHGKEDPLCVGVDGCKKGWLAVSLTSESFEVTVFKTMEELCTKYGGSDSLLIDMPIGLPESTKDKRPEGEARKILAGRASCVFNAPCRQAVYAWNYEEACRLNKMLLGTAISKQSHALCRKIREIDLLLEKKPELKGVVRESHPEVCFAMLYSDGHTVKPIPLSKHTEEGLGMRISLLERHYPKTKEILAHLESRSELQGLLEDCLDALCLAVTGRAGFEKGFGTLPEKPMTDSRGIPMQMVFAL